MMGGVLSPQLSAADGSSSGMTAKPNDRKAGSEVADTISLLAQHRPTSGDGKPGIFRMQAAGEADLIAVPHSDDLFVGRGDFWFPVVDGQMAIRIGGSVLRYQFGEKIDIGLGDLNLHWDWAPTMKGPNGLLVSVDTTWDTATRDRLGVNRHTIAPAAAYVIPISEGMTFAPAIEHRLSWGSGDGSRVSLTDIHAYFTWLGNPTWWLVADPAISINHEADRSWMSLDVEAGFQVTRGLSAYARPGFALGDERPYDVHLAAGVVANF